MFIGGLLALAVAVMAIKTRSPTGEPWLESPADEVASGGAALLNLSGLTKYLIWFVILWFLAKRGKLL